MAEGEKKLGPFDEINRICKSAARPTTEELERFDSWLTETYFSMHQDMCMLAELASTLRVPEEMHEAFYRGVVRKEKRGHFWPKAKKDEQTTNLMKWFDCSAEKAREMQALIGNSEYLRLSELHNRDNEKPKRKKAKAN